MRFIVEWKSHESDSLLQEVDGPIFDLSGRVIEVRNRPVKLHEYDGGHDIRTLSEVFVEVDGRYPLGDLLPFQWRRSLIIRNEVLTATEKLVDIDPTVYRCSVVVLRRHSRVVLGKFTALWPLSTHNVLDRSNASVISYPGTDVIHEVVRWAIDFDREPKFDLYATDYQCWICTEAFRSALKRLDVRGINFLRIL